MARKIAKYIMGLALVATGFVGGVVYSERKTAPERSPGPKDREVILTDEDGDGRFNVVANLFGKPVERLHLTYNGKLLSRYRVWSGTKGPNRIELLE